MPVAGRRPVIDLFVVARGEHGPHVEETVENAAVLLVELVITGAAQGVVALVGRQVAQLAEGLTDGVFVVGGQDREVLHGAADLRPLVRRKALKRFGAVEHALAGARRQIV